MSDQPTRARNGGVCADPLFVGVTRPAMSLGVPYAALLANVLVTMELFLVTRNLLWLSIAAPLHGLSWLVCLAEPRFFELIAVWGQVRSRAAFVRHSQWRATSYGSFATARRACSRPPVAIVENAERVP